MTTSPTDPKQEPLGAARRLAEEHVLEPDLEMIDDREWNRRIAEAGRVDGARA